MVWQPKFELISAEPFIDNLKAVFQRDAAAAIAWASPTEQLRSFQAYNTARQVNLERPALNLIPFGNDPSMNEDAALIQERRRILVEIEASHRVPNTLARHLVRYALAARSILYEMSADDLTGLAVEIPQGNRAELTWDVSQERYTERYYESENSFIMVGSVVLTINYSEGKKNV